MNDVKKVKSHWDEEWVDVETTGPLRKFTYKVSNYGRIKSINPFTEAENIIKGTVGKRGFVKINVKLKSGKREGYYVHHIVAKHWVTKKEEQQYIIHLDNNKSNNHHTNLRWGTRAELNNWMHETGIFADRKPTLGSHVKMNEAKVALLKKRILEGKTKRRILAKQFDISYTQLKRIENGVNWGHVQPAQD